MNGMFLECHIDLRKRHENCMICQLLFDKQKVHRAGSI